uniref:dnaJ homolog subfamily C member 30, mitochondrial-like n=1 Tax=Semicossyphus pulcher TaxID=241346 RepID=UPI0037E95808
MFVNVDHAWEKEKYVEFKYYIGLKDDLLSNKTPVQNIERSTPKYWINGMFRRTFSTLGTAPQQSLGSLCLCCGHGQFGRAYSGNGSYSEPLYKTKTGYYEILEVTSKATQAQIKTAYYKQSFIYHPDRNASSDEATVRFSEISEAYAVLGNKALRKKYDRGLLSQSDLTATVRPSSTRDTSGSSAKQQTGSPRSVVGTDNRVFNFDTFFKEHYGELLQKQKDIRDRKEEMLRKKQESFVDKKLGRTAEVGLLLMLMMAVTLLISVRRS